jgi:hypothetical protein
MKEQGLNAFGVVAAISNGLRLEIPPYAEPANFGSIVAPEQEEDERSQQIETGTGSCLGTRSADGGGASAARQNQDPRVVDRSRVVGTFPPSLGDLLRRCWRTRPRQRPTMMGICAEIEHGHCLAVDEIGRLPMPIPNTGMRQV